MLLNFNPKPRMRAYLHHAYTWGILELRDNRDQLLNHYIQLEVRLNDQYSGVQYFLDCSPFTNIETFCREGGAITEDWSAEEVSSMGGAELATSIRELLNDGKYVAVYLDEYYLPSSACHLRTHQSHEHLLVGFEGSGFVGAGYRADQSYGLSVIPERMLVEGIFAQPALNAPWLRDKAIRSILLSDRCPSSIDGTAISTQVQRFLSPDGIPFDAFTASQGEISGFLYGVNCYDFITWHLDQADHGGGERDLRYTRLVWERAAVMCDRVDRLMHLGKTTVQDLEAWGLVQQRYRWAHLAAFQANLDARAGGLPRAPWVKAAFESARELEVRLLGDLVCKLHD